MGGLEGIQWVWLLWVEVPRPLPLHTASSKGSRTEPSRCSSHLFIYSSEDRSPEDPRGVWVGGGWGWGQLSAVSPSSEWGVGSTGHQGSRDTHRLRH